MNTFLLKKVPDLELWYITPGEVRLVCDVILYYCFCAITVFHIITISLTVDT